ncbi:MAG: hypothetical protein JXA96_08040 [Sedimentisphaerales bacterium]|nr:hypothetical protein [Sedimentisphaerales bacterium]
MDKKQDKKGKRKKLKKLHILIPILFLFLTVGIIIHHRSGTKSKLHRKIEELHAAGYPVTLKELDELYSIPDSVENAADFILDAIYYYKDTNDPRLVNVDDWVVIFPKGEVISDTVMKNASQYLQDNQKSLGLLHKAATLKYCRYPVDLSTGQKLSIIDLLTIMRLLGVEAVLNAENGDSEASVKSLICSLNVADSLSNAPLLVGQLVRIACLNYDVKTLEYIVNLIDFTDEQLAQLCDTIADKQRLSGLSYGLTGELCDAISNFENYTPYTSIYGNEISLPKRFLVSVYRGIELNKSDLIIYLEILNKTIEAGKLPLEKRLEAAKKILTEIDNTSKIHLVVKTTAPSYPQYLSRELTNISKLRAAQAALAIQRYRLKIRKLPDSLSDLVPEYLDSVLSDPYDGKELRYKKLDPGFVVYSIDKDLIDDGGMEEPKNRQQKIPHWDITFTIKK